MRLFRRGPRDPVAAAYARAPLPGRRTPWREASWCAVDLELSGLDPRRHEIISFGAVPIESGRVQLHRAVSGLVRPTSELSESSIRVHGILAADLEDAPGLDDAIGPLLGAMTGRVLVVHTAQVERAFLSAALGRQGVKLREPLVDTNVLGELWLRERDGTAEARSLSALAAALGLPADRPHSALGDAVTTAQAFIALASHLDAVGPETVRSLAAAGHRLETLLGFPPRSRCC
jgi:DNA polymerase III subunit epsilon